MNTKIFSKNDDSFICINCGAFVDKLHYSSRDHCNRCLTSLHVDINPGDRLNDCRGLMQPIGIEVTGKGNIIHYRCQKCGELHKNKAAEDDDYNAIISASIK
jgi:DNA-directed RNA polymerase subunit RPC12/RpoP